LYRELLRNLAVFYKGGPKTGVSPFLEQYRLSWLYAPDDVVKILNSLAESLRIDPAEGQMTEEERQLVGEKRDRKGAEEIAHLVAAIRRDLFATAGKITELDASEFGHYS
jgi:hypothetical protein